jgi:hypothetical protein
VTPQWNPSTFLGWNPGSFCEKIVNEINGRDERI